MRASHQRAEVPCGAGAHVEPAVLLWQGITIPQEIYNVFSEGFFKGVREGSTKGSFTGAMMSV